MVEIVYEATHVYMMVNTMMCVIKCLYVHYYMLFYKSWPWLWLSIRLKSRKCFIGHWIRNSICAYLLLYMYTRSYISCIFVVFAILTLVCNVFVVYSHFWHVAQMCVCVFIQLCTLKWSHSMRMYQNHKLLYVCNNYH